MFQEVADIENESLQPAGGPTRAVSNEMQQVAATP